MDEEKMQRHMEFLLEWQAQFAAELAELKERDQRNSENITRLGENVTRLEGAVTQLEGVVERVVGAVGRLVDVVDGLTQSTRERFEAVDRRADDTDRKIAALVDSQMQTEEVFRKLGERIDRLAATVERQTDDGHNRRKDEPEG